MKSDKVEAWRWTRQAPLVSEDDGIERWTLVKDGETIDVDVHVRCGKPINIEAIKQRHNFEEEVEHVFEVKALFEELDDFVSMDVCPACGESVENANKVLTIWKRDYYQCGRCSHAFSTIFPSEKALLAYYEANSVSDGYYTYEDEIDMRIREIYTPKVEWIVESYTRHFGSPPKSILDVGAGSAHFLKACRDAGMAVGGVEQNSFYREWSRKVFDLELVGDSKDLMGQTFDVVCSFNVIEHFFNPTDLIEMYRGFMHAESMAVLETPRFNSMTSMVQKTYPEFVRGHVYPYNHNHMFTDASLATFLYNNELKVSDIWYFGQDMVEMVAQLFNDRGCGQDYAIVGKVMAGLQPVLDAGRLSDLMLVAAVFQPELD